MITRNGRVLGDGKGRLCILTTLVRLMSEADEIRCQMERAEHREPPENAEPDWVDRQGAWMQRAGSARRIKLSQIKQLREQLESMDRVGKVDEVPASADALTIERVLFAALSVCKAFVSSDYYESAADKDPIIKAVDDLDKVEPKWEDHFHHLQDRLTRS
jgi:hypothetical protein